MVVEEAIRFGRHSHLVGVVTRPKTNSSTIPGMVLINAGLVYRVGPSRLHVRLARAIAASGVHCLRFDLSGIGDSTSHAETRKSEAWVQDVRDAIDFLMKESSVPSVVLFGICAGAVRAFDTALLDSRVGGIFLVDGHLYRTWKTRPLYYFRRARSGLSWFSVLKSKIRRLLGSRNEPAVLDLSQALESGRIPKSEYAEGLSSLASRGAWVSHVMSGGFPTLYNYASQFGEAFAHYNLGNSVGAHYFPEATHTFSEPIQQQRLIEHVVREVTVTRAAKSLQEHD